MHIATFSTYRKSFCTFICQVSLLTSSCQFFMNPSCSLLPCASLMFFWYLFIMLPQGSLGFLLFLTGTSSDWSRGFSSCQHLKMGKHIAKSSSLKDMLDKFAKLDQLILRMLLTGNKIQEITCRWF